MVYKGEWRVEDFVHFINCNVFLFLFFVFLNMLKVIILLDVCESHLPNNKKNILGLGPNFNNSTLLGHKSNM